MHAFGEERRVGRPLLQPGNFALGVAVVPFRGFHLLSRRCQPFRKACVPAHQILQSDGARRRQQERGQVGIARLAEADQTGIDLGGRLRQFLQTSRHVAVSREIAGFECGFAQSPEPVRDRQRLLVARQPASSSRRRVSSSCNCRSRAAISASLRRRTGNSSCHSAGGTGNGSRPASSCRTPRSRARSGRASR